MKKEEKKKVVPKILQKRLGSLVETRDNADWFNETDKERKMETLAMILPVVYVASLIGIVVFFGGGESSRTITNRRRNEDDAGELFNDITDPARSYLIQNIHNDNSAMEDNSFDWDDSSAMSDMSSSSWDD